MNKRIIAFFVEMSKPFNVSILDNKELEGDRALKFSLLFLLAISFLIYISYVHIRKYYESRHIQLFQ